MSERASPQPSRIGPYKILDCLGEGGMGTVYLAEQKEPVQRKVALKVIKLGMDSKAVVARFEQERQALALMQHDGIAKVFDCGTTESGQPFFAMEYVKGVPLVDYCDQHKLSIQDRIALLQQVCSAVQHAHQKGVVHRDLKPGNVLVDDQGGKPQAKVIDFGLAKAMGQKLGAQSLFTEKGVIVGTLEYMAPEQADATNADIDTRADVYSLGVVVYETLTGQLPFSRQELLAAGELEMRRILREVDPPKPSKKLSGLRDSANAIAARRQTSFGALHKALAVDLDWLVLKALEKDRNRRYATASALADDLQRFLDSQPVLAGPPSAGYRLRKFARRQRHLLLAVGAVVGTALVGMGMSIRYANRAQASELDALRSAFLSRIRAAAASLDNGKLRTAQALLADEDSRFSGWEYGWLRQRVGQGSLLIGQPAGAVALHPSEPWVTVGGESLRVYSTIDGRLLRELPESVIDYMDFAWLPDGRRLLACQFEMMGTTVWDAVEPRLLSSEVVRGTGVGSYYAMAVCKNRGVIALSSDWGVDFMRADSLERLNDMFVVWDNPNKVEDRATCLVFSPDENKLGLGFSRGYVGLYDMETKDMQRTKISEDAITDIALDASGNIAAGTAGGGVYLVAQGAAPNLLHQHSTPDRARLLAQRFDDFNALSSRRIRTCVAFVDGDQFVISGGDDCHVRIADLRNRNTWSHLLHASPIVDMEVDHAGKRLLTAGADGVRLLEFARLLKKPQQDLPEPTSVDLVAVAPDGSRFAVTDHQQVVEYDARSGVLLAAHSLPQATRFVYGFSYDASGERLMAGCSYYSGRELESGHVSLDGRLFSMRVFDAAPVVVEQPGFEEFRGIAGDQHSGATALSSPDGLTRILGEPMREVRVPTRPLSWDDTTHSPAAFCDNGRNLAVGQGPRVTWFDVSSMAEIGHRIVPMDVQVLVGDPKSPRVFFALEDSTDIHWIDIATGESGNLPPTHQDVIVALCIHPSGNRLVSASERGEVVLWDARGLEPLIDLPAPESEMVSAFFTPDGNRLVMLSRQARCVVLDSVRQAVDFSPGIR